MLALPWIGRDDASRYRAFWGCALNLEDGSAFFDFPICFSLPPDFSAFGAGGITLRHRVHNPGSSGAFGGSDQLTVILSVYDPTDGTTQSTAERNVTSHDSDYTGLTIDAAELTMFQAGDLVHISVDLAPVAGTMSIGFRMAGIAFDLSG